MMFDAVKPVLGLLDPVVGQVRQDAVLPDAVCHIFCQEAVLRWKIWESQSNSSKVGTFWMKHLFSEGFHSFPKV